MKKLPLALLSIFILAHFNSIHANAQEALEVENVVTEEVEIPVRALLTPYSGYEEKNAIEAVLYGALPNSCYEVSDYKVERNDEKHTIAVKLFATRQVSGDCADEATLEEHSKMIVPFTKEIHIGNLPAGTYQFIFKQQGGTGHRIMNVAPNKSLKTDTDPYAIVSTISVPDRVDAKKDVQVVISGTLNSSCIKFDKDAVVENQNDVSVIRPIVTIEKGKMCAQALIPFEKRVNLGKQLPQGVHLIHSRSMNGKAVNKVILLDK